MATSYCTCISILQYLKLNNKYKHFSKVWWHFISRQCQFLKVNFRPPWKIKAGYPIVPLRVLIKCIGMHKLKKNFSIILKLKTSFLILWYWVCFVVLLVTRSDVSSGYETLRPLVVDRADNMAAKTGIFGCSEVVGGCRHISMTLFTLHL
jgi:hypothetical protein